MRIVLSSIVVMKNFEMIIWCVYHNCVYNHSLDIVGFGTHREECRKLAYPYNHNNDDRHGTEYCY